MHLPSPVEYTLLLTEPLVALNYQVTPSAATWYPSDLEAWKLEANYGFADVINLLEPFDLSSRNHSGMESMYMYLPISLRY